MDAVAGRAERHPREGGLRFTGRGRPAPRGACGGGGAVDMSRADDRAARYERLIADAEAVRADLDAFLAATRAQLAKGMGPPAVTAQYGDDRVLAHLHIEAEARKQLTESQLLTQINTALTAS